MHARAPAHAWQALAALVERHKPALEQLGKQGAVQPLVAEMRCVRARRRACLGCLAVAPPFCCSQQPHGSHSSPAEQPQRSTKAASGDTAWWPVEGRSKRLLRGVTLCAVRAVAHVARSKPSKHSLGPALALLASLVEDNDARQDMISSGLLSVCGQVRAPQGSCRRAGSGCVRGSGRVWGESGRLASLERVWESGFGASLGVGESGRVWDSGGVWARSEPG